MALHPHSPNPNGALSRRRVLHRCRLASKLDDEPLAVARERLAAVLAGIDLLEMSTQIKQRTMDPFPVHVRTLDALHIATVLTLAGDAGGIALFSHDKRMNLCARCLGFTAALA